MNGWWRGWDAGHIAGILTLGGIIVFVFALTRERPPTSVETCWADPRPPHDDYEMLQVFDGVPSLCRRLPPKTNGVLLHVFDGTELLACYPLTRQECPK